MGLRLAVVQQRGLQTLGHFGSVLWGPHSSVQALLWQGPHQSSSNLSPCHIPSYSTSQSHPWQMSATCSSTKPKKGCHWEGVTTAQSRADYPWFLQQALAQVDDLRLVSMLEMCVNTRDNSLGTFGESPYLSTPPCTLQTCPVPNRPSLNPSLHGPGALSCRVSGLFFERFSP